MRTEKSLVGDPYFPAVHVEVHAVVLLAALENFPGSQLLQAQLTHSGRLKHVDPKNVGVSELVTIRE